MLGLHDAEFVLGDQSAALAGHDADGFLIDQEASCCVALLRIGRRGNDATLDF